MLEEFMPFVGLIIFGNIENLILASQGVVKGVNIVTKHNRPSNANPDGGITKMEAPIHASNVAYLDPVEKKPTKLGYKIENGKKVRYCKLSGTVIK